MCEHARTYECTHVNMHAHEWVHVHMCDEHM